MKSKEEVFQQAIVLLSEQLDLKSLKFEAKEATIIEFSFGLFIERTYRSLKSISILIRLDDEELENSIGLISRSILTDFFQVFCLVELNHSEIEIVDDLKKIFNEIRHEIICFTH